MSVHVLGVVRGSTRLGALTYETQASVEPESPWQATHACELRPLPAGSHRELAVAWDALASVRQWDAATLRHVQVVLDESVPCGDHPGGLPPLAEPAPPPRATGAHPRGFRGTKVRPSRRRGLPPVDVRPYLLARREIDQVLVRLGARGVDAAVHDPWFAMHLLPLVRSWSPRDVRAIELMARALDLAHAPELYAVLVGVAIAAGDAARVLGWWSHVLAHAPEERLDVARLVCASGVARRDAIPTEDAAVIADQPHATRWLVYRMVAAGAALPYARSGLALGAINGRETPPAGQEDVTAVIRATLDQLGGELIKQAGLDFWRRHLWELSGKLPGFAAVLGSAEFIALESAAARSALQFAGSGQWWTGTTPSRWEVLGRELVAVVAHAVRIAPPYQQPYVEHMGQVYWGAVADKPDVAPPLETCTELCLRIARPPFVPRPDFGPVLPALAHVRDAVCAAPDASWLVLEHACRRENQARVLGCGLERLVRVAPALVATTFARAPNALFAAADALAAVSREAAARLLAVFAASPIADPALAEAPLAQLCAVIDPIVRGGGPNPIRRVVRKHLAGTRALTAAQLRGHQRRLASALDAIRLSAIGQAAERSLAGQVGRTKLESEAARHAVAMLGSVALHRRQLRRLLTAALAGDVEWRLRHPRTTAWFARHPRLDRAAWLAGHTLRTEIAGLGTVELAIERDPLEALRLGTHVGSCLGRGGHLAYSAAAIVLDANKHVIYARDPRGSVIGRQVVAISEAEELVCFWVYGVAKRALEPVFRVFDTELAAQIGLPLLPTFGSYEIASILSHEWWDDLAWDVSQA